MGLDNSVSTRIPGEIKVFGTYVSNSIELHERPLPIQDLDGTFERNSKSIAVLIEKRLNHITHQRKLHRYSVVLNILPGTVSARLHRGSIGERRHWPGDVLQDLIFLKIIHRQIVWCRVFLNCRVDRGHVFREYTFGNPFSVHQRNDVHEHMRKSTPVERPAISSQHRLLYAAMK